jgi:hypothetical protein
VLVFVALLPEVDPLDPRVLEVVKVDALSHQDRVELLEPYG